MESGEVKAQQRQKPLTPTLMVMESGEVVKAAEPQQPKKRRRLPKPKKSAQADGGSSGGSAVESSSLSKTSSSSSPPSDDAGGGGGGGGKRPRLVWTEELHDLFLEAYNSLGDDAVPLKILEKMNERVNLPEVSRANVASHLQKHKLSMRRKAENPISVEASSHSPTEVAPAPASLSHSVRSLPPITPLPEASQVAPLGTVQVFQTPPDCLSKSKSRSSSSITVTDLQILQSIQQQLCGEPIEEGQAQRAETMQGAPADSGCSLVGMETSTAALLVPEANTEAVMISMAQAANEVENSAEQEAAPAGDILGQFWASQDNEAPTSSWDIFGLSRGQ